MAGFFGLVLFAFILEAVANIRKDPKAMARLSGALRRKEPNK